MRRLFHERTTQKLSVQSLETLAVIAYKQPVTAPEISEIRGVNTSGVLNTLIERKLIKIVGRKAVVGRPFMYATTREFLDRFGLNDIADLPKVEDLADVLGFDPPSLDTEPTATPLAFDFDSSSEAGSMESGAAEETNADETSAEEASVEEAIAEEVSVDETSVDETVVEEAGVDETDVEEGDDADRENLVRDGEPSS